MHVPIETSIREHDKTLDLAEYLNTSIAYAVGLRVMLWTWCMVNLSDYSGDMPEMGDRAWGVLLGINKADVEIVRNALCRATILHRVEPEEGMEWAGSFYRVHNWGKTAGKLWSKNKDKAAYMRNRRAQKNLEKAVKDNASVERIAELEQIVQNNSVTVTFQPRNRHVTSDKEKEKEKDKEKDKEYSKSHSGETPAPPKKRKVMWSGEWVETYQMLCEEPPPLGPACSYLNKLAGTYTQLEVSTVLTELTANRKVFKRNTELNAYLNKVLQNRMAERVKGSSSRETKTTGRGFEGASGQDEQWEERYG